jgi:hypothetical protein
LLPSIEGDEIEVTLASGFLEKNLHVVDRNAAIVATLKRRYPRIQTYGVDVLTAVRRRIPKGTLHLANLDLCAPLGHQWAAIAVVTASRLSPEGVIAATYLRGRDSQISSIVNGHRPVASTREEAIRLCFVPEVRDAIFAGQRPDLEPAIERMMSSGEPGEPREQIARRWLGLYNKDFRVGHYQSGHSPMSWVAGTTAMALPRLPNRPSEFPLQAWRSPEQRLRLADLWLCEFERHVYASLLAASHAHIIGFGRQSVTERYFHDRMNLVKRWFRERDEAKHGLYRRTDHAGLSH